MLKIITNVLLFNKSNWKIVLPMILALKFFYTVTITQVTISCYDHYWNEQFMTSACDGFQLCSSVFHSFYNESNVEKQHRTARVGYALYLETWFSLYKEDPSNVHKHLYMRRKVSNILNIFHQWKLRDFKFWLRDFKLVWKIFFTIVSCYLKDTFYPHRLHNR